MNLPEGYSEFLKSDCDRKKFIQDYLDKNKIRSSVICLNGKNHIYVDFLKQNYDNKYKLKTLVAHYDRVDGAPGANDNSSGVFALLDAAVRISKLNLVHNTRIIFTDGEEDGRFGVASQGAFSLAKRFVELNNADQDVIVFDCVGRGDVPVLCELNLPPLSDKIFAAKYKSLTAQIQNVIGNKSSLDNIILPASFSDNAGFVANKIPSVAITMLPKDEVINYMSSLKRIPGLAESVMNRRLEDVPDKIAPEYILRESIPLTWRYFHTRYDTVTTLTPVSFSIIAKIIDEIVKCNFLR